jgi:hypothetical protein
MPSNQAEYDAIGYVCCPCSAPRINVVDSGYTATNLNHHGRLGAGTGGSQTVSEGTERHRGRCCSSTLGIVRNCSRVELDGVLTLVSAAASIRSRLVDSLSWIA